MQFLDFESQGGTDTLEIIEETIQTSEPGDHERLSHYVEKDKLADAIVFGHALTALCGKKWVPHRDASQFPVCPECKEKWEEMEDA